MTLPNLAELCVVKEQLLQIRITSYCGRDGMPPFQFETIPRENQKGLVTIPLHRMEVKLEAHHWNPSKPSKTVCHRLLTTLGEKVDI